MSREEATAVFQNFTRGRRSERDNGAGLGLPISRAIMRAMGGDLTLEFLGDGSSYFRLVLKRHRSIPGPDAAASLEALPAE